MKSLLLILVLCAPTLIPEKPTVYVFTAVYCPFCWAAQPGIRQLEKSEKCTVERINANASDLSKTYKITGVPTLVVVRGGKEVFRSEGSSAPAEVKTFLGIESRTFN